jgi:hypothetical protein
MGAKNPTQKSFQRLAQNKAIFVGELHPGATVQVRQWSG